MKFLPKKATLLLTTFLGAAFYFSACSTEVAGGVSEETNTVAGILKFPDGNVAARVAMQLQSIENETAIFVDTTDAEGKFSLTANARGLYGLSANANHFAYYDTVSLNGKSVQRNGDFVSATSISGNVYLRSAISASQVAVQIPGSPWKTTTDENGYFVLNQIPEGEISVSVSSPDKSWILGQTFDATANHLDSEAIQSPASYRWILPLSPEYKIAGYWTFDEANAGVVHDSRSISGSAALYGNAKLELGRQRGKSLHLQNASDFAVIENDKGILDSAKNFTIEMWVDIQSIPAESAKIKNILGKLSFGDSTIFSIAVVQDTCGVQGSAFGFFLAEGNGDSLLCENAAISKNEISLNRWNYLAATWNGDSTILYVDGKREASAETKFHQLSGKNIPIYLGKENLDLFIDDVKIYTTSIEDIDAIYRYNE